MSPEKKGKLGIQKSSDGDFGIHSYKTVFDVLKSI